MALQQEINIRLDKDIEIRFFASSDTQNFLVTNSDAATAFGVDPGYLRALKSGNIESLLRDDDWVITRMPTKGGYQLTTCWSRQGMAKLSTYFYGERAKKIKEWADNYSYSRYLKVESSARAELTQEDMTDFNEIQYEFLSLVARSKMDDETREALTNVFDKIRSTIFKRKL